MAETAAPPAVVTFTLNGVSMQAAPGTLLIEATRKAGVEIPAFCYYEGLSLQAACRMCLVEVEKMPKLMAACTLPVAEGMVVQTESEKVVNARKYTLEFLLTNHPLDCPVCDKGGECELQDMVFRYGAGESRFIENKVHSPEKQWSPVVYFDPGRCILCYRCVRQCNEGMGVGALGVTNRGVTSEITPNKGDHLECDECGACIDICPVGALTSGTYRYQTRPWEMEHKGTVCTHCSNGCKTTLGVRNDQIIRGNNRDRSGINGEFLCVKGRYGFDFVHHEERLQSPMMKINGNLEPVSWAKALAFTAQKFREVLDRKGSFGIVGGAHTTNEENYYLQKFARQGLHTANIDHQRSGDIVTLLDALKGRSGALATVADLYATKAALILGSDLSQQHPLLAWQLRASARHHKCRIYTVTNGPVREDKYSVARAHRAPGAELDQLEAWREQLKAESELTILYGASIRGEKVRRLVAFADSLGIPVKFVCLLDYSNSRGAMDMGVLPDLLPGYHAAPQKGLSLDAMLSASDLDVFWCIGSNPLQQARLTARSTFIVVQDLFLTETAQLADVVFPSASAYEKNGTVTSVTGEVQRLQSAVKVMGSRPDLEIMGLLAKELGFSLGMWTPDAMWQEISSAVKGYDIPLPLLATGAAAQTQPVNGGVPVPVAEDAIRSAGDTLFTSGTLGRYSKMLNKVMEAPGQLYRS
jgi:NADH-quinone oxidoreductase subunit G